MRSALTAFAFALLVACTPGPAVDPYLDPAGSPPPTVTDPTVSLGATAVRRSSGDSLVDVIIPGFVSPDGLAVTGLTRADITVVEDGKLQGFTVAGAGAGANVPTDIVFVFDTTSSMAGPLDGVKNSIIAFANSLQSGGLDVRLGAVTFGDAFDTKAEAGSIGGIAIGTPSAPPTFDPDERPTFALSSDFEAFKTFIGANVAAGGGDLPENGVGALAFAYSSLEWRAGAQRVLVVITDVEQHDRAAPEGPNTISPITPGSRWDPPLAASLLTELRGNAVVHAISPDMGGPVETGLVDMLGFTGAAGTGGVWIPFDFGGATDLTALPLGGVISSSTVVTFRGETTGGAHEVRIVVNRGDVRGEVTTTATY